MTEETVTKQQFEAYRREVEAAYRRQEDKIEKLRKEIVILRARSVRFRITEPSADRDPASSTECTVAA